MDNVYEISLLLDFYGNMLTERQSEILDLHYNSDFSFSEIAEQIKISRQGVYDNIKRGKSCLYELENKLGLMAKFSSQRDKAGEVLELLEKLELENPALSKEELLNKIKKVIRDIINSI